VAPNSQKSNKIILITKIPNRQNKKWARLKSRFNERQRTLVRFNERQRALVHDEANKVTADCFREEVTQS